MTNEVKILHVENGTPLETAIYEPTERELCITAEDALRELARGGLVSFIIQIIDPDRRERVRSYLQDVMSEITHDAMEGM